MMVARRTFKQTAIDQIHVMEHGTYSDPIFYFYLGDIKEGIKSAYQYSRYFEEKAENMYLETDRIGSLFEAALHRDLARAHDEAHPLWQAVVERRRKLSEAEVMQGRSAGVFIYEGYALAKLERWDEVAAPVNLGFDGIRRGKGFTKAPHRNTREYGLAGVLLALSQHHLSPNDNSQPAIQKTMEVYKRENVRYGRVGYEVIFDLQFSYPHLLTPVLPDPDPLKD
jgi:hypothetical protein